MAFDYTKLPKCSKCNSRVKIHKHHVLYEPEIVVNLCSFCHDKITFVNAVASVLLRKKLSKAARLHLWNWFFTFRGTVTEDKVKSYLRIEHKFTGEEYAFIGKAIHRMHKTEYGNSDKHNK